VKFSNSGLHLACSIAAEEKYIIAVYSVSVTDIIKLMSLSIILSAL
jgi:hypothetical protein